MLMRGVQRPYRTQRRVAVLEPAFEVVDAEVPEVSRADGDDQTRQHDVAEKSQNHKVERAVLIYGEDSFQAVQNSGAGEDTVETGIQTEIATL